MPPLRSASSAASRRRPSSSSWPTASATKRSTAVGVEAGEPQAGRRPSTRRRSARQPRQRLGDLVARVAERADDEDALRAAPARARWRSSASVCGPAQCRSSRTTSPGRVAATSASNAAKAPYVRYRSASGSTVAAGGRRAEPVGARQQLGERRPARVTSGRSATRAAARPAAGRRPGPTAGTAGRGRRRSRRTARRPRRRGPRGRTRTPGGSCRRPPRRRSARCARAVLGVVPRPDERPASGVVAADERDAARRPARASGSGGRVHRRGPSPIARGRSHSTA